jgi:hypothetical protein
MEDCMLRKKFAFYIPADEFLNVRAIYQSISVNKLIATDLGGTAVLRPLILGSFKYYEREFESSKHQFLSFPLLFFDYLLHHAKSSTIFLPPQHSTLQNARGVGG